MGDLATAANAHDAAKVGPIIDSLDGVCEGCHLDFDENRPPGGFL